MPLSVTSSRTIAIRMSSPSSIACRPAVARGQSPAVGKGVSNRAGLEAVSSPGELTERPKGTAMPPYGGLDVLSLTRQGSRRMILRKGKLDWHRVNIR
jgi:hypothetical protein